MRDIDQKTILLVEDEVLIAMAEAQTLEQHGYSVITVFTSEQALNTVAETPGIDLILMDINLEASQSNETVAGKSIENSW